MRMWRKALLRKEYGVRAFVVVRSGEGARPDRVTPNPKRQRTRNFNTKCVRSTPYTVNITVLYLEIVTESESHG